MVAAAQRIGNYEVLEPSSEEVEKVRGQREGGSGNVRSQGKLMQGKLGKERAEVRIPYTWVPPRVCPSFLPSGEGPRGRV